MSEAQPEYFEYPNEIKAPIYFANKQWAVTDYGLECLATYYPIEACRLWEMDWESHVSSKVWIDGYMFHEALGVARKRHKDHFKRVSAQIDAHEKTDTSTEGVVIANDGNVVEL